jgi:hypothetical protein
MKRKGWAKIFSRNWKKLTHLICLPNDSLRALAERLGFTLMLVSWRSIGDHKDISRILHENASNTLYQPQRFFKGLPSKWSPNAQLKRAADHWVNELKVGKTGKSVDQKNFSVEKMATLFSIISLFVIIISNVSSCLLRLNLNNEFLVSSTFSPALFVLAACLRYPRSKLDLSIGPCPFCFWH